MLNKIVINSPHFGDATDMLTKSSARAILLITLLFASVGAQAQSVEQVRWKSEGEVREMLGDPNNVTGPVGTHASYTMWKYDDFTVAFANKKAFHLFNTNSLRKVELNEGDDES